MQVQENNLQDIFRRFFIVFDTNSMFQNPNFCTKIVKFLVPEFIVLGATHNMFGMTDPDFGNAQTADEVKEKFQRRFLTKIPSKIKFVVRNFPTSQFF